ncbi:MULTISPECIES: GtrA family protein [Paenibacillus]|uniref:GtrA family protein n=1 Tax=Paenibacillus TaxID=44249 RepID=UPI00333EED6D
MKFLIIGFLNTIVSFLTFALLLHFINLNYIIALVLSYLVGVIHSYLWNLYWTFSQKESSFKSVGRFIIVYILTFLVNLLILYLLVDYMMFNKFISQGVALFVTTLISYFGHKYWSFRIGMVPKGEGK